LLEAVRRAGRGFLAAVGGVIAEVGAADGLRAKVDPTGLDPI
jgi:hypothetical protein